MALFRSGGSTVRDEEEREGVRRGVAGAAACEEGEISGTHSARAYTSSIGRLQLREEAAGLQKFHLVKTGYPD